MLSGIFRLFFILLFIQSSLSHAIFKHENYVASAAENTHNSASVCPDIPEFSKQLDKKFVVDPSDPTTDWSQSAPGCKDGPQNLNKFNKLVLDGISSVPPGGGNSLAGRAVNVPLAYQGTQIVSDQDAKGQTSNCSGGPFIAFLKGSEKWEPPLNLNPSSISMSGPLFNVMNNDRVQMGDIQGRLARDGGAGKDFGEQWGSRYPDMNGKKWSATEAIKANACPGDFLNFTRKLWGKDKKNGHSAIFLGVKNGRVYWWTSNSSSNGWGIDCAKLEDIDQEGDFALTRVKDPSKVTTFLSSPSLYNGVLDGAEKESKKEH